MPSTGPERAIVSACSFSAARFSRKQQERQRRASGAKDSGHGERALEFVGERGGKRSAAVEPDPVVGNPADQPDMREAEPWHHALLGEQNGGYRVLGLPADQSRIVSSGALLVWVDVALPVLAAAVVIALAAVARRFGR